MLYDSPCDACVFLAYYSRSAFPLNLLDRTRLFHGSFVVYVYSWSIVDKNAFHTDGFSSDDRDGFLRDSSSLSISLSFLQETVHDRRRLHVRLFPYFPLAPHQGSPTTQKIRRLVNDNYL